MSTAIDKQAAASVLSAELSWTLSAFPYGVDVCWKPADGEHVWKAVPECITLQTCASDSLLGPRAAEHC